MKTSLRLFLMCLLFTAGCAAKPVLRASVEGPLTVSDIQQVFASYRPELRELFEAGTSAQRAQRDGNLRVSFRIASNGWVQDLRLAQTDITDKKFLDEVLVQIGLMRFPAHPEFTEVSNYPLNFDNR